MIIARAGLVVALLATAFVSCSDDKVIDTGDAGSNTDGGNPPSMGDASTAADASSTPDASGDASTALDASTCIENGTGEVVVEITGLPAGLEATLTLSGPDGDVSASDGDTLPDLAAGGYDISGTRVTASDPLVRTLYAPVVSNFCVAGGASQTLTVEYAPVQTSNKLWVLNSTAQAALVAYPSASLGGGAGADAGLDGGGDAGAAHGISVDAVAGTDLSFDREGNLWVFGPTSGDPSLIRYSAASLIPGAEVERNGALDIEGIPCIPPLRAMAFDPAGDLWVSTCGGRVVRLPSALLSGATNMRQAAAPDVEITGLSVNNQDVAFDSAGNLWVADDGFVVRFNADRLAVSDSDAPDLSIELRNAGDTESIGVDHLTFDSAGNLWGTDFAGNFVAQIDASELDATGNTTVVANVSLVLSVAALLNRPAFDDEGGLWISFSRGRVARLAPSSLTVSTNAGSPTVPDVILEGGDLGYAASVAFFPAAAGLPLFHAYP